METKEELVNNIKEWIKIDTDIIKLQNELKERKAAKKALSDSLMEVMKKNQIDNFDIKGGSLQYKTNKVKKPLTGKVLVGALQSFFSDTPKKAEELTKFLMENREEQIKESIKRKVDK